MEEKQRNEKTPILDFTVRLFCGIDNGVQKLNIHIEELNWNFIAFAVLGVYVILHIVISLFHEPSYDEAVAWQISKYASLQDILFVRPHYEGHPPFWHLILLLFSRLGCPYELSLSVVSLLFAGATVALILFKAPFPKPVRIILPFTYFFFYQYGVISRPYCVMMLAFLLSAITYKNKDTKPFAFVLSLVLLCLSSAYGILIAGGIAVVWLIEIIRSEKLIGIFYNKRRFAALLFLLVCAVLLVAEIYPAEDAYAENNLSQGPADKNVIVNLIYTIFVLPADATVTNIYTNGFLNSMDFTWYNLLCGCVIGLVIWTTVIFYANKKKTVLLLIIPYFIYAVFSAMKYMCIHHIGIGLLLFAFWAWVSADSRTEANTAEDISENKKVIRGMLRAGCAVFLIISFYWSAAAVVGEINNVYSAGRYEADFIKENNLTDYKIYACYDEYYAYDAESEEYTDELAYSDLNHCFSTDNILAYFDGNIFCNFNDGNDSRPYTTHKVALSTENADLLKKWNDGGVPDVIINFSEFKEIFGAEVNMQDYTLVFAQHIRTTWKDTYSESPVGIFVRKELAEELGLNDDLSFIEYYMVIQ